MPVEGPATATLFVCTRCGECCRGYGGTYLTAADIDAIAAFVGISTTAFIAGYTRLSGKRRVIAQGENGYCIFWGIPTFFRLPDRS